MPKLYEYLGIILFFYSNEHEPIHMENTQDVNQKLKFIYSMAELAKSY